MNETLLTMTLLLVCACNLGVLYRYFRVVREMQLAQDDSLMRLVLNRLSSSADRERRILQRIGQEHKATRKETQEIKTRLAWSRKRELEDAKREGMQS